MIAHFLKEVFLPLRIKKTSKIPTNVQKKRSGTRDKALEDEARALLLPFAPALAERVTVGWNSRFRTTAGIAIYHRSEIWLNPALQKISEREIQNTLRHELAHLLAHERYPRRRIAPHGKEWQTACSDLDIPNESRTHQLPFLRRTLKRHFFYSCPSCQETFSRVRKPRRKIACLACCQKYAGGHYDERFRYREVKK